MITLCLRSWARMAAPLRAAALAALLACAHARGTPLGAAAALGFRGGEGVSGGEDDPSEVLYVPGYQGPLPSRHFAGYVTVDERHGRQLFYYLAESQRAASDPVVLWLNGGPGCSSFDGFVYEHGPFSFAPAPLAAAKPDGAGGARLTLNPYAWSTVAHVIYLDSPAGVGLSYSETRADYVTNDTATAADADAFLRSFMARYPRFADNELYIAGESYAGIYVPNLARAVLRNNAAGATPTLNLLGYAVGNGCTDEAFDGDALVPFALGKSLISADLAAAAAAACATGGGGPAYWNATDGSVCAAALDDVDVALQGLNLYDTLEDCVSRDDPAAPLPLPTVGRAWPLRATLPPRGARVPNWAVLGVSVPCMDTSLAAGWLNAPAVRAALHAAPAAATGKFAMCSDAIEYTHDAGSMLPVHAELLQAGLRALVYSGDHDMCVPHTGTEAWTRALGLPIADAWRAWLADGADGAPQVAGYTRRFEGGLTYATVKGAGHTVPAYKPAQALAMFARFLQRKPL